MDVKFYKAILGESGYTMYQIKEKKYAIIAILYYIALVSGYFLMGWMYKNEILYFPLVPWIFLLIAIMITFKLDKSLVNIGLSNEKLKVNFRIGMIIILLSVGFALLYSDLAILKILKGVFYYLFYIALMEEMIFRGFLQNYLFGLHIHKFLVYVIGASFFSFIHLPFQMFIHDMVSFSYIVEAGPQLLVTFLIHFLMCLIAYKSKDIIIPTALHFALDFIQAII